MFQQGYECLAHRALFSHLFPDMSVCSRHDAAHPVSGLNDLTEAGSERNTYEVLLVS